MPADRIVEAADREEALARLRSLLRPGDAVLVKASRGIGLEVLVEALVAVFSEGSA
jgi:UDP-N-acetylmuramoyl-tripeptide--D-alanyl-D-alanine ligase